MACGHYAPLATIYPDHDYGPAMRLDPQFHAVHSICLPFMPSAARLMATIPDVMLFFNHAGGSMVMVALLQAAMEADDPHAARPVSAFHAHTCVACWWKPRMLGS
jgi:hypothetical protein